MKWKTVQDLAASHGLEIYTPMCGYHRQAQIIDRAANRHYWTANKAIAAHQSILAIVHQKELGKLTDDQAIAQGEQAKTFF
jgi:hypothetical protein